MTPSAPHRGPALVITAAALAAVLAAAVPAYAQQGTSPPAAPAAAAPAKPKKADTSATSPKSAQSYSLGVAWGSQLHDNGITPADVINERFMAGLHDALSGKVTMTPADQQNLQGLLHRTHDRLLEENHNAATAFLAENAKKPGVVTTASGLQYKVLHEGTGAAPKPTDTVVVNYRGTLLDGKEFDSSYKRGEPATFVLNRVIPGWTEGLQLMKPGAKYQLFVPPQLAYGDQPRPPIPPGSLLTFDVELVSVQPPAAVAPPAAPAPGAPGAPGAPVGSQPPK
jgi:FKBP-type peptidyl-prolyl cis-trans isomerase